MGLDKFVEFVDSYAGRDKILRLLSYGSRYLSRNCSQDISSRLLVVSSQLSSVRTAFRLIDIIPAVSGAINYGFGKEGEDKIVRILNILSNVVNVLFCPVDNIAWCISCGVIRSKNTIWDTLNTSLWIASILLGIMMSLRQMHIALQSKDFLRRCGYSLTSPEVTRLSETQSRLLLKILKLTLDLTFAVHYLPPGILWSGTLEKWRVGALGTASSAIAIYQALA